MADLTIYYEHPQWFKPLFGVLERRGIDFSPLPIQDHVFDPSELTPPSPVIFNRLAMSSFLRQGEHAIYHAIAAIAHWELGGAQVINGTRALQIDTSKARQLSLFRSLGLAVPTTRVIHRREDVLRAAADIGFPLIVKPNVGGSGSGVVRYESAEQLKEQLADGAISLGIDGVSLVQEYVPARDARVIRCETLNGRFLYAIALNGAGSTFDLCPADVCLANAPTITVAAFQPPEAIIKAVEAVAQAAHLDIGGVEYFIDDRNGVAKFYDINGLSNFVAQPLNVLGWDPHEQLADYLSAVIGKRRQAA